MGRPLQKLQRFFRELKRRNVYKVAIGYLVAAFVALQAADLLVPETTLPTGTETVIVYLTIAGFPIALVIAWAFEMTPKGVRRTSDAEDAGGDGEADESTTCAADRSIAVLPFDNLSGTDEAEPFVNGLHDDLLTRLSNISGLKVISRTSVLPYRETELGLPAIADSLGVTWIVEGGVQQTSGQVQVNAQLIQAREDAHQWAESYRRELTTENLFAVQSELTKKIARSLQAELSPQEEDRVDRRPTGDVDAYRLYVRGRIHLDERSESALRRGASRFQEAIRQDPTYGLAWSGLADTLVLQAAYGYGDSDTLIHRARDAATRALNTDPELAEAHASLGLLHYHCREGPSAVREFTRAIGLRPSYARAHHWLGNTQAILGKLDEALPELQRAIELDPHSASIHTALSWAYWWAEGPEEKARSHAEKAVELSPEWSHAHEGLGLIRSAAGFLENGNQSLQRAVELASEGSLSWAYALGGLGSNYAQIGDVARAREILTRLEAYFDASLAEGLVRATLGEHEAALETLRAMEWQSINVWALRFMPAFDPLRRDPDFRQVMREINQSWGLNPDGSLPDSVDVAFDSKAETDG